MVNLKLSKLVPPQKALSFGEHLPPVSIGRVIDVFPVVRMYAVEVAGVVTLCAAATPGFKTAASGSNVIVVKPTGDMRGYVIADIGSVLGDMDVAVGNQVVPFKGVDLFQNASHLFHLSQKNAAGLDNFNVHSPLDVCQGSDVGEMLETGVGYGAARFHSFLRASDVCGVWAFFFDNLLRTSGFNRDDWSSMWERLTRNDEGTLTDEEYFSVFPWEAFGRRIKKEAFKESARGGILEQGQLESWFIPEQPDQISIPRVTTLRGKYGAGLWRVTSIPEKDKVPDLETRSSASQHTGLLEVRETLDGFFGVKAARGFMLEKTGNILVPKRMARQEDPAGDAGESTVTMSAFPSAAKTPVEMLAEASDALAYRAAKGDVEAIRARAKDYFLPDDSAIGSSAPSAVPAYKEMTGTIPLPPSEEVAPEGVDKFKVYRSRAFCGATPDGSIVLSDGYGGIFALSGGNAYTSVAGDIFNISGRNIVNLAGRDSITRAAKSVDVSADYGDIRLLADRNVQALAGNSGKEGSLMLESRGEILEDKMVDGDGERSKAAGVYIKSSTVINTKSNRDTVIRADQRAVVAGDSEVNLSAPRVTITADSLAKIKVGGTELVGTAGEVILNTGYFRNEAVATRVAGSVTFNSSILVGGSGIALGAFSSLTGEEAKKTQKDLEKQIADDQKRDATLKKADETRDKALAKQGLLPLPSLLTEGRPSAKKWKKIMVTARSSTEYGTDVGFTILQAPWQPLLSVAGVEAGSLGVQSITGTGKKPTQTYPGADAASARPIVLLPSNFMDMGTGVFSPGGTSKVDTAPLSSHVILRNPEKTYGK